MPHRRAKSTHDSRPIGGEALQRKRAPGLLARRRLALQQVPVMNDHELEVRFESVNLFNHVNLGNPDSTIGVPGNPHPNAGRITSTANGGAAPQRNFQFALKYSF
jgi:hypothetical protein